MTEIWHSAAPVATEALFAIADAIGSPNEPKAYDGPIVKTDTAKTAIVIGHTDDQINAIEQKFDEPGYSPDQEDAFRINNQIRVLNVDADPVQARRDAYGILAKFAAAIADDPSLDEAVMQAWIAEIVYRTEQGPKGVLATLDVAVDCIAHTGH